MKTPVLNLKSPPERVRSSLAQRRAQAQALVKESEQDLGLIVCLNKDGTLAGTIAVDRPVSDEPFSQEVKNQSCDAVWPGTVAGK
jgi:hypothetical protein